MNVLRYAALAIGITWLIAPPAFAQDSTLTFNMKSNHRHKVQVEFYSQNRSHAWPGGNRAYNLDDYDTHTFRLNCRSGERICYGAWVSGNQSKYWGVGLNNRQRCTSCCAQCNGGTVSYVLNP